MRNINLFVEDVAHEDFLTALIQRLADAYIVEINIKPSSVRIQNWWTWKRSLTVKFSSNRTPSLFL